MSEYFKNHKNIQLIRNDLDGYLSIEKEINNIIEDGYASDKVFADKLNQLERAINIQYSTLEKHLNDIQFEGHPIELIELYAKDKLKAIQLLESLVA